MAAWTRGASATDARALLFVFEGSAYEGGEERMRFERLGFEFGVELAAEEPGVIGGFDDFDVIFVGGAAGDAGGRRWLEFFRSRD